MLKSFLAFQVLLLVFEASFQVVESFSPTSPAPAACHSSSTRRTRSTHSIIVCSLKKDDGEDDNNRTFQEKLDKFLDTPFFDPDKVLSQNEEQQEVSSAGDGIQEENGKDFNLDENRESSSYQSSNPIALWFAKLVKNDYETAEALYAAGFISFMVIVGQELLRYQINGDNYIPFQRGHGGFGNNFDW